MAEEACGPTPPPAPVERPSGSAADASTSICDEAAAAVAPQAAAENQEHKHRHHHKQKQHRHARKPSSSRSYEDLTAVISSSAALGKRPKSFTQGQAAPAAPAAHRQQHHHHGRTAGALQPAQLHRQQQHGSQLGHQHGSLLLPGHAPRRASPLRQAEPHVVYARAHHHDGRQPPGSKASSGSGGTSGSGGSGGSSMTGSRGGAGQQRQRVLAEFVKVQQVAKGFASSWLSKRVLNVFDGSSCVAPAAELLRRLPCTPCLHIWLVRAPRSRQWVPVHLGGADNLRQGLGAYLHDDGSCGPLGEPSKRRVLLDLMCRGFAVQVRYRPLKAGCASIQDDLLAKLAAFDFPLNGANNGGCRPIELERPAVEYPLVVAAMEQLYCRLHGPRRRL